MREDCTPHGCLKCAQGRLCPESTQLTRAVLARFALIVAVAAVCAVAQMFA